MKKTITLCTFILSLGGCGSDDVDGAKYGSLSITDGPVAQFVPCATESRLSSNSFVSYTCSRGPNEIEELRFATSAGTKDLTYSYRGATDASKNYDYIATCLNGVAATTGCGDAGDFPLDKTVVSDTDKITFSNTRLERRTVLADGTVTKRSIYINGALKRE
jgi:hypothetical protein